TLGLRTWLAQHLARREKHTTKEALSGFYVVRSLKQASRLFTEITIASRGPPCARSATVPNDRPDIPNDGACSIPTTVSGPPGPMPNCPRRPRRAAHERRSDPYRAALGWMRHLRRAKTIPVDWTSGTRSTAPHRKPGPRNAWPRLSRLPPTGRLRRLHTRL